MGIEIIEIDQQLEAQADVFAFCEMRPSRSLDVAGGKAVFKIAVADVFEDRLPCRQRSGSTWSGQRRSSAVKTF